MKKGIVLGSFAVDMTGRAPHLPVPGETVKGSTFRQGPGGKGFNQCVAAHKAGAAVTMVTKLGRDSLAHVALDVMAELAMPQEQILFSGEAATGVALIMVDECSSQNQIVILPGACATITREEVQALAPQIREASYLLLQLEINQSANEQAARIAKESGVRVIVNTAPYQPVSDEFLRGTYLVTPNETEAQALTGIAVTREADAARAAAVLFEKGVENVVITLGSRGVYYSGGGASALLPAFSVPAVDTTGAGDAFNGGLLTALLEGKDLREACVFASALAALSVQKPGTTPSMPSRGEIDRFLRERGN
jgi:ribokinase